MNIVPLPSHNIGDVSDGLRRLADDIDAGKYRDAYNVLWIVDCGAGTLEFGMLGKAAEPGPVALLLMRLAEQKLIAGIMEQAK